MSWTINPKPHGVRYIGTRDLHRCVRCGRFAEGAEREGIDALRDADGNVPLGLTCPGCAANPLTEPKGGGLP